MTLKEALDDAIARLSCSESPLLDAEILLAHVLKKNRAYLYTWPQKVLTSTQILNFNSYIERAAKGVPLAYLLGYKEFWSLKFLVNDKTLIPRPETELLVTEALAKMKLQKSGVAIDLGTGSGAIALILALENPTWSLYASDQSAEALTVAKDNADQHQIKNIKFCQSDWLEAFKDITFDLMVSNPPYIAESEWPLYLKGLRYEPREALIAKDKGLAALRIIIEKAPHHLKKGGWLLLEHGFEQGTAVRNLLKQQGFSAIETIKDFSGHERVTLGCIKK